MMTGKARVLRVREMQQMLFEEYLIDEFEHGEAPSPMDRRAIRVVQNAQRLVEAPRNILAVVESGVIADESGRDMSDDSACFTQIGVIEIEHPGLNLPNCNPPQAGDSQLTVPAVVVEDSVTATIATDDSPATATITVESIEQRGANQMEMTPAVGIRIQTDPVAVELEFEWWRFVQGILVGAAAAVVFLGMVSTL